MNILACILKLCPDWKGVIWGNSYDGIKPHELETRPIPALEELEAVWPEVQAEMLTEQKRQAYKTEADPLYAEWQALLFSGHEDAEARRQEWIAKRAEIAARFE
jgi:hypothetical protein